MLLAFAFQFPTGKQLQNTIILISFHRYDYVANAVITAIMVCKEFDQIKLHICNYYNNSR